MSIFDKLKINKNENNIKSSLDESIDICIKCCCNNFNLSYEEVNSIVNKMACWYGIKYKDTDNIFSDSFDDIEEFDGVFESRREHFSFDVFLSYLNDFEKSLFSYYKYEGVILDETLKDTPYLYFNEENKVTKCSNIRSFTNYVIDDSDLIGLSPSDVLKLFRKKGIHLGYSSHLPGLIENEKSFNMAKSVLLFAVLYKIIKLGGVREGPVRGLIFAEEFNLSIDVAMSYGLVSDFSLSSDLISAYLALGGEDNLKCYLDYFTNTGDIEEISISEYISKYSNDCNVLKKGTK